MPPVLFKDDWLGVVIVKLSFAKPKFKVYPVLLLLNLLKIQKKKLKYLVLFNLFKINFE